MAGFNTPFGHLIGWIANDNHSKACPTQASMIMHCQPLAVAVDLRVDLQFLTLHLVTTRIFGQQEVPV
jgi:hypothetical protein